MKIQGSEVSVDFESRDTGIVWAVDPRWNSVTEYPSVHSLVATSSWQQLKTMFIPAKHRHVIAPGVDPVKVTGKADEVRVCWAGDPTDGTLSMLLGITNALIKNSGKKFKLFAAASKEPNAVAMQMLDKETCTLLIKPDREQVVEMFTQSRIFAHPSMSWESYNPELVTAMSAGCVVVAPKHSGFPEMCGASGFLTPHSLDTSAYGTAFASVLMEVIDLATSEVYDQLWRRQKLHVDWVCGREKEDFAWKEFLGFTEFMDNMMKPGDVRVH